MTCRNVVLAVECDFKGYQPYGDGCSYNHSDAIKDVSSAVDLAKMHCQGKAVFLAHTSPYVRRKCGNPFYTSPDYTDLWKKVNGMGGEVGIHPHEEEPDGRCFYYYYSPHMAKVMEEHVCLLRSNGIEVTSQMMGYFGMNEWITPLAENLGITASLNNAGKYIGFSHNDWRDAPSQPYFHSYEDIKTAGESSVLEIPLGVTNLLKYEDGLVLDTNSFWDLKRVWRRIQVEGKTSVCFVLLRTCEMSNCRSVAAKFLRFLADEGAVFQTPSEVYRTYRKDSLVAEVEI